MQNERLKILIGASTIALTLSSVNIAQASSKYATTTANLNFRTGPSTNDRIISTIKKGSKVEVVSNNGAWSKIKYNNKEGYSSSSYLKYYSSSSDNNSQTTQGVGTVTASILNIRNGASTSSSRITKAKKGEKVTLLESKNGWYRVKLSNGKVGWCSATYIKVGVTNPAPPPIIEPEKPVYTTNKVETNYDLSFDEYAQLQNQKNSRFSVGDYKRYMNINQAPNGFQFLRLDTYRDINVDILNSKLVGKGILEGQGKNIANAARRNNIDPVYFIAQSILETGHGKSNLAKGITITEIADESNPIYKVDKVGNKILVGYKMIPLNKPTTVYNLYGIGAKDNLPEFTNRAVILGTTYAYKKGWTNIESALNGAASFVADNYIHSSKFNQNTVYKFIFNPTKQNIWHQYATDISYAEKVSNLMKDLKNIYTGGKFTFDVPVYSNRSTYSILDIDLNKANDTHLSIQDMTNY